MNPIIEAEVLAVGTIRFDNAYYLPQPARFMFIRRSSLRAVKKLIASFLKYLVAGGMGFVLDYGTLTLCYEGLGWHYLVAATCGFLVGLVFVYISSNKWVFDTRKMKNHRVQEFAVFSLIGLIGLGLTNLFMWGLVDGLGIHPLVSKLFTTGAVLIWNYGARKIILY